jgi:hypothetical protein
MTDQVDLHHLLHAKVSEFVPRRSRAPEVSRQCRPEIAGLSKRSTGGSTIVIDGQFLPFTPFVISSSAHGSPLGPGWIDPPACCSEAVLLYCLPLIGRASILLWPVASPEGDRPFSSFKDCHGDGFEGVDSGRCLVSSRQRRELRHLPLRVSDALVLPFPEAEQISFPMAGKEWLWRFLRPGF